MRDGVTRALHAAGGAVVRRLWAAAGRVGSIGPDSAAGRRFGRFGERSIICFPQGPMFNERYIHLGSGTLIGPGVAVSAGMAPGQQCVTDPVVRIGDRCLIGRNSSIVGHFRIDIGDDVWTGPNVYITDQNHGYEDLDEPISRQTQPEREVLIGDGSWLGAGSVVLPGARVGRHVTVGANSVVRGDLPDNCVAVGSPARVVRYHDGHAWVRPTPDDQPAAASPDGQPLASSPGGAQRGMPLAEVKSLTTLLTGPPAAPDSR